MIGLLLKHDLTRTGLILLAAGFSAGGPYAIALGGSDDNPALIRIHAEATSKEKKFSSHIDSGSPFRFRACKQRDMGQISAPKGAELFRVAGEEFVPVEAQFNMGQDWTDYPDNEACIADLLVLDVDIKSKEIYCIGLRFDYRNGERVHQNCWQLTRKSGVFEIDVPDKLDR